MDRSNTAVVNMKRANLALLQRQASAKGIFTHKHVQTLYSAVFVCTTHVTNFILRIIKQWKET